MDTSTWLSALPDVQCGPAGECHFGDPATEAARAVGDTVVAPLSHLGHIVVSGDDADTFLQGQLSNDVRLVTAKRSQLTSMSSAKGRLLAIFQLLRSGPALDLEVHRNVLEPVLKKLRLYVLRSKVKLAEAPDRIGIGVAGPGAGEVLSRLRLKAPDDVDDCRWKGAIAVVRRRGAAPRYSILSPIDEATRLWERATEDATPVGTQAWRLLDILAGVPTIYPETQERFVAQMCNLDALGAISFDKGCYTGQEIIARVHYRGAVKRTMSLVLTQDLSLVPGSAIDLPGGGKGEVVDAALHPNGGSAALVVAGTSE